MVKPVPALGLFHAGSPSHCAVAGVASSANPSVNAVRFISAPSRLRKPCGTRAHGPARWSNGRNRGPASQSCVAPMHLHEADRHTGRLVEEPPLDPPHIPSGRWRSTCRPTPNTPTFPPPFFLSLSYATWAPSKPKLKLAPNT